MKRLKYEYCIFKKSTNKGVFDKVDSEANFPFYFLKFEKPKRNYLINNGVEHVIQSWDRINKKDKILHTGLIPINNSFYYGNNINEKGKIDFILIWWDYNKQLIHFWLIKNKNPKRKRAFAIKLIDYFN